MEELRKRYPTSAVSLKKASKVSSDIGTVGQERAIEAIHMGITMNSPGYNIFVCGTPGIGRTSAVKSILKEAKPQWSKVYDHCYVYNFRDPDRPRLLVLPPGEGSRFKREMEGLIEALRKHLPLAFEASSFRKERQAIINKYRAKEKQLWTRFEQQVRKKNFVIVQLQEGPTTRQDVLPVVDGKPCTSAQLSQLIDSGRLTIKEVEKLTKIYMSFQPKLRKLLKKSRDLNREMIRKLEDLDETLAAAVIGEIMEEMKEEFPYEKIHRYLDDVMTNIIMVDLDLFKGSEDEREEALNERLSRGIDPFLVYKVNVVLDNSETTDAPFVHETSPTYNNLFGTIERVEKGGHWRTDFTGIRSGSILRANGGFLVINAIDVLTEPRIWSTLKRTLKNRQLEIQEPESYVHTGGPSALKPEPIPLNLKVVMIGHYLIYHLMSAVDEDFAKIFKVKAEFDSEMEVSEDNVNYFVSVVSKICKEEGLRKLDKRAFTYLLEEATRMAGRKEKLSTRFSDIANIVREADYWAAKEGEKRITRRILEHAIAHQRFRNNLYEQKLQEMIDKRVLRIEVEGEAVGQVNGLAVYQLGRFSFGKPSRISASVGLGKEGIVNIEREVALSGATHDKGVLILEGFFRNRYGSRVPLAFSAGVCFEQSYGPVDGDSASSTELYALLSAFSGLPIKQGIAVTGSVDQRGNVQAIGGVNEKIEGFFDVCRKRGLTGEQGVMIPVSNVDNLMLKEEVVQAVADGLFHIYPVATIDEGIEILTGVPAGERGEDGEYPPGTVNRLVEDTLRTFAERIVAFYRNATEL